MNTCSTESSADNAVVRSAQASITVRARDADSEPKEPWASEEKTTTSVRPDARRTGHSGSPSIVGGASVARGENDGKRFSKTTTSYADSAISVGKPPGTVGA